MLNKAIFTRLYLDSTNHQPTTTATTLSKTFASLIHATRTTDGTKTRQTFTAGEEATTNHLSDLLTTALAGQSASKAAMVELRGIEPLTFSMRKTGTAVDGGYFRTSQAIGVQTGAVIVGVVAVLPCCTADRLVVARRPAQKRRSGLAGGPIPELAEPL